MIKNKITLSLAIVVIFLMIAFLCNCIALRLEVSTQNILSTILVGVAFICVIVFWALSLNDFNKKHYYISFDHKFFSSDCNIFDDAILKKSKKIVREKKCLKDKLSSPYKHVYFNENLKLKFVLYELKDNFQLLAFSDSTLNKMCHVFSPSDNEKNAQRLIEKCGIRDCPNDENLEGYYTNDKRFFFSIDSFYIEGTYCVFEWEYRIKYSTKMKEVIDCMGVDWVSERNEILYENLEEARDFALNAVDVVNSRKQLHYFVLNRNRIDSAYHEFQPGNKKCLYWENTSIYLYDDIMDESKFHEFLNRFIPNYDYFGNTLVSKDTWELLKKQVEKESNIIQEIFNDMKPWVEKSIKKYGCFTIIGI